MNEAGEPWFIAADVCAVLGLDNVTKALLRVDDDDKTLISIQGRTPTEGIIGRQVNIISESGFYSLVLSSRKPVAKPFKRWVTHEVLPSIRKTGFYVDRQRQLTTLSQEQIYRNLAAQAETLRKALPPGTVVDDHCNLLNRGDGKERSLYFKEMDKDNMPGIAVITSQPVRIVFDWFNRGLCNKDTVEAVYSQLRPLCSGYKSILCPWAKPFEKEGELVEIGGFSSIEQALELAEKIRGVVITTLS